MIKVGDLVKLNVNGNLAIVLEVDRVFFKDANFYKVRCFDGSIWLTTDLELVANVSE